MNENKKKATRRDHTKKRVTWVGTSISNVLDKKKFEKDCDAELNMVKAYCVDREEEAVYKEANFKAVVPKIVSETETDILILQTGSIEITDLNIESALKDTTKNLQKYKQEWFKKIEEASTTLIDVAESAITQDNTIEKVVIVKRLARFDKASNEIRKIRSDLSEYGNSVYDQILLKRGRPEKIQIVDFDLKCSESGYLKGLIFGKPGEQRFDGVHLRGKGAKRHFTYRAVQAIKPVISFPRCEQDCPQQKNQRGISTNQRRVLEQRPSANQMPVSEDGPWQLPSASGRKTQNRDYADIVRNGNSKKQAGASPGVPTHNYWNPLNC